MSWFWYVARADELMMDCDGRPLLEIALKRLDRDQLKVRSVFAAPSSKPEHYHLVFRLTRPMPELERMVWQLYFMDHVYRSVKNLFRVVQGVPAPSLLISPQDWCGMRWDGSGRFWRSFDAECSCSSHKDPERIKKCPAHIILRGQA